MNITLNKGEEQTLSISNEFLASPKKYLSLTIKDRKASKDLEILVSASELVTVIKAFEIEAK